MIQEIKMNVALEIENVISFRKKMNQKQIQTEVSKFIQYVKSEANKTGPMISATFSVEIIDNEQVLDMEFLIPIDREIESNTEYQFKSEFYLVNAVYTRFTGDPQNIQGAYDSLMNFIQLNNLHPITAAYNVNLNDEVLDSGALPVIDIYIGINPSKL